MNEITICANPSVPWQKEYLERFRKGFAKHGIKVIHSTDRNRCPKTEVAMLFGPNYWKNIERTHDNFLQVNRAFLGHHTKAVAISWDGFNGLGRFCAEGRTEDKLYHYWVECRPWINNPEGYTLLFGQHDLGRCGAYASLAEWHQAVVGATPREIMIRPWPGRGNFERQIAKAHSGVSLNSTVIVEALIAGLPMASMDRSSPAWAITSHRPYNPTPSIKRMEWLHYLAHCQWNWEEIERGDFWDQLSVRVGPRLCDVEF